MRRAADRANEIHLVDDERLDEKLDEMLRKVQGNAPLAIRAMKQATVTTLDLPYDDALRGAHAILDRVMGTADAQEGMRAFVEKRKPQWKAR